MLCLYDYTPAQKGKSPPPKKNALLKVSEISVILLLQILPILAKTTKLLCKNNPDEFFWGFNILRSNYYWKSKTGIPYPQITNQTRFLLKSFIIIVYGCRLRSFWTSFGISGVMLRKISCPSIHWMSWPRNM